MRVSKKALPKVLRMVGPVSGAVQENQTEAPPELPAMAGSPVSLVAEKVLPLTRPHLPVRILGLAKLLLPAGTPTVQVRAICPLIAPFPRFLPSTAIR